MSDGSRDLTWPVSPLCANILKVRIIGGARQLPACVPRPLHEVASSQLARRCFVGNLYKQVKDPILVGALSGHKEGSKAFARYREIDESIKIELVKMLE